MRTRSTKRKRSTVNLLASPPPETAATPGSPNSPKEFEFNFKTTDQPPLSSSIMKKKIGSIGGAAASLFMQYTGGSSPASSILIQRTGGSSPSPLKGINTISDLKELASSQLESIRRQLERSQSEILKEIEASQSRLHKRFKIQTQECQQVMDEAEREYKQMLDGISETRESMEASYTELLNEAQSSASRLCKTSIPAISESFEKTINSLRSRYGIS